MTRRRSRLAAGAATLALAAAFLVLLAGLSPRAEAFIYWANFGGNGTSGGTSIGRANLDGSGVDNFFINGASFPCGVAVNDTGIFWGNQNGFTAPTTIGRADIDGGNVNQSFVTGVSSPCGIALDDSHIYWADWNDLTVGRSDLDGGNVNSSFVVPGASHQACNVAVDDTSVFWSDDFTNDIGRAPISGTPPNPTLISTPSDGNPCGIAVNGAHLYWTDTNNDAIGRANLDGSAADPTFITGGSRPCGIAVDDTHIYWANLFDRTIGRANLDGSGVDQSFITNTATFPCGIAVDDKVRPTSTAITCSRTQAAINQPTTCTATVTDTGPASTRTSPAGSVSFASASPGAGFAGKSNCTLAPAGAGASRCSVTYLPGGGINLLQGIYGGDPESHAGGSAVARVTVSSMSLGAVTLNRKSGTATLAVNVPAAGAVALSGAGVQTASAQSGAAGSLTLPIAPDQPTADTLWRTGSAPIAAIVTFTPQGGGRVDNQPFSLTLEKQLRKPKKHHRKKHKKHKKKGHHKKRH